MGQKELLRVKTLEMVNQGRMTLKAATITLGVSYRQGIRLYGLNPDWCTALSDPI